MKVWFVKAFWSNCRHLDRPLRADRVGRPDALYLDRLGNCQRVCKFDAEVTNGAVHLRVTEQQLDGAKVPSLAVYLEYCV